MTLKCKTCFYSFTKPDPTFRSSVTAKFGLINLVPNNILVRDPIPHDNVVRDLIPSDGLARENIRFVSHSASPES